MIRSQDAPAVLGSANGVPPVNHDIPTLTVLGVPVAALSGEDALKHVGALLDEPGPALLAYVNTHSLNLAQRHPSYRRVLHEAALVLNDGSGLAMAAKVQGKAFPDNLNGTDFTPAVLKLAAERDLGVFLLGGQPGVAQETGQRLLAQIPGLRIVGSRDGYFPAQAEREVIDQVRASGAAVLLVAFGNPKQELWLAEHLSSTGATLGVAVGAFLDFAAQRVPRAPQWMHQAGVEWLYRLGREPLRLFHRYVIGNPLFLFRVWVEQLRRRRKAT